MAWVKDEFGLITFDVGAGHVESQAEAESHPPSLAQLCEQVGALPQNVQEAMDGAAVARHPHSGE